MTDYVSERVAALIVSMDDAITEMAKTLIALERGDATVFPVVLAQGLHPAERFGMKSGTFQPDGPVGLKVGTYWPSNRLKGLPNHGSTTLLLDPNTGLPEAIVSAAHLTALRTAGVDGVAIDQLARQDATTLGIVGAGHQAWFEAQAALAVRPGIRHVRIANRDHRRALALAERIAATGLQARAVGIEEACDADIVIAITAANAPLIQNGWIRPGTHVSAMGADARGKYELDPALVVRARLFADVIEQSVSLGEFETAFDAGLIGQHDIQTLGSVLTGGAGRTSDDDVTIFDSSGIALQDLAIARLALDRARSSGLAQPLAS